jgi:hypothetical protein
VPFTGGPQLLRSDHVGDARLRRRFADLQGVGDLAGELVTLDGPAAGDSQGQDHPLGLCQAGPGQLPFQDRVEGLFGLADNAGAEGRVDGHCLLLG